MLAGNADSEITKGSNGPRGAVSLNSVEYFHQLAETWKGQRRSYSFHILSCLVEVWGARRIDAHRVRAPRLAPLADLNVIRSVFIILGFDSVHHMWRWISVFVVSVGSKLRCHRLTRNWPIIKLYKTKAETLSHKMTSTQLLVQMQHKRDTILA